MHLQESGEMYLETILVLSSKQAHVRSIDISEEMHFSKPSVSRAVKLLKESNYIDIDSSGYITLTEEGNAIATKIYERHNVLSELFTTMGVHKDIAAEDACKVEHDISDETLKAIKKFLKKIKK